MKLEVVFIRDRGNCILEIVRDLDNETSIISYFYHRLKLLLVPCLKYSCVVVCHISVSFAQYMAQGTLKLSELV